LKKQIDELIDSFTVEYGLNSHIFLIDAVCTQVKNAIAANQSQSEVQTIPLATRSEKVEEPTKEVENQIPKEVEILKTDKIPEIPEKVEIHRTQLRMCLVCPDKDTMAISCWPNHQRSKQHIESEMNFTEKLQYKVINFNIKQS